MPHAEKDGSVYTNGNMSATPTTTNGTPLTNGEKPSSKVLSHLQSYPVVHDSLEYYRAHPYGAKSLTIFHKTYAQFVAPLHPYLQTPYSYLHPYLSRADELGDSGLTNLDTQFPIVKEETSTLKEKVKSVVGVPLSLVGKGKQYVFSTWEDEYKKTGGQDGWGKTAKAIVSTELKVAHDGLSVVKNWWAKGEETVAKKVDEVKARQ
ncbi:CAP20-like protein [Aaosphaeria arxii CBS 175.79]|uniref:CAP20-like protein n=1 Tax=Aaosphaeria arxii CBS 175.79 TaxID=1450172 RepID=A0A6A5XHQ7_9PLEO|nr:CAP20-like protein [Aaosphaeria arxii CBS 175.79]KAF2011844.1 CAP20-like protein [Aaosphaeria arxii CBS 175.79]